LIINIKIFKNTYDNCFNSFISFISLGLVVTVPVALATPGEWESSKVNLQKVFKLG
jgi:photosystem II core protein PsbZ